MRSSEKKRREDVTNIENRQDESNRISPQKNRNIKEAFEAQRQILNAKYQRESDTIKKNLIVTQETLKSNK